MKMDEVIGNHCKASTAYTEYTNEVSIKQPESCSVPHGCLSNHIPNRLIRNTHKIFAAWANSNNNQGAEDTTKARLRKAIEFNDWQKLDNLIPKRLRNYTVG